MSTVAVILAADPGEGFTEPRHTVAIKGVPMLEAVVSDAATWPVDEVIVVLGADAEEVERRCDLSEVSVLVDPEWGEGSAAPLRAVLDLLSRDRSVDRCVVARGDQPGVAATTVERLLQAHDLSRPDAVIPKYRYATGWPVVLSRRFWDVFLGLEGEVDIHHLITTHAAATEEVWIGSLSPSVYASADDLPAARR